MNKFESYKDSGIEWIGEIPTDWETDRIGRTTYVKGRIGWKGLRSEDFLDDGPYLVTGQDFKDDSIEWSSCYHVSDERYEEDPFITLQDDDILITKDGTIGKVVHIKKLCGKTTLNSGIFVTRPLNNRYLQRYFYWVITSPVFKSFVDYNSSGSTIIHLYQNVFDRFFFPIPPLEEQKLISRYLDKKTEQIDSLIEKIQRKIELLKEQRTSLINQCVTKGLDPNVEMKDSGVEWIGDIPKHWNVTKLKYFFDIKTGRDPNTIYSDDGPYQVLGTGGVIGNCDQFMYDQESLILGRKGTIDKPFIQNKPFWISDVVYYTTKKSYITPKYLFFLFTQVSFDYYKYGSTLPSMSKEDYENMKFPIPPESDLNKILHYLNKYEMIQKEYVDKLFKKIRLLQEYRQSLISSVVTGKVRITEDMI